MYSFSETIYSFVYIYTHATALSREVPNSPCESNALFVNSTNLPSNRIVGTDGLSGRECSNAVSVGGKHMCFTYVDDGGHTHTHTHTHARTHAHTHTHTHTHAHTQTHPSE